MKALPRHEPFLQNQYSQLLTVQILLMILPALFSDLKLELTVGIIMITIFVTLILRTFQLGRAKSLIYLSVILGAGVVQILTLLWGIQNPVHQSTIILSNVVYLTFLAFSIYFTMNSIFRQELVTSDSIRGGICVYFFVGYLFYFIYRIIYITHPNSFNFADHHSDFKDLLYFSFVSLTTIGYGDITPNISITMSLSILEGVFGQMYPAVVMAQLVSQYINSSSRSS